MRFGDLSAKLLERAFGSYLRHAYSAGKVPEDRRQYEPADDDRSLESLLALSGVERIPGATPDGAEGYAFRIGCAWYRHLKMMLQPYDSPPGFVLGVDTHDAFDLPADSPDAAGLKEMQANNRDLARRIEQAWEADGLPTQAGLLRKFVHTARSGEEPSGERTP